MRNRYDVRYFWNEIVQAKQMRENLQILVGIVTFLCPVYNISLTKKMTDILTQREQSVFEPTLPLTHIVNNTRII